MATELNVKRFDQYWKSAIYKTLHLIIFLIFNRIKRKAAIFYTSDSYTKVELPCANYYVPLIYIKVIHQLISYYTLSLTYATKNSNCEAARQKTHFSWCITLCLFTHENRHNWHLCRMDTGCWGGSGWQPISIKLNICAK